MTRKEHIEQLKRFLKHDICMCPASKAYWKEHCDEIIAFLTEEEKSVPDMPMRSYFLQAF